MKKAPILIICILLLAGAAGWGVYSLFENEQVSKGSGKEDKSEMSEEDKTEVEELQKSRAEIKGIINEEDLAAFKEEGLNPFGHEKQISELTDTTYQEYIHGMSHQKIKASKKWGFYEIHPERIQWLLEGLDEVELQHENVYRDILGKWNDGDFASADDDHNQIWSLQGGTVGKATGILSPEEEQEYVENKAD